MSAFLVDRSARFRMTMSGEKAKEALGGLVTNDVAALVPGAGQLAVALTPKGRVIAMVRVFDRGADLLVDGEAASAEAFIAMIRKFVNPRMAKYAVVSDATACLGVYGHHVHERLASLVGLSADALLALPANGIVKRADGTLDIVHSTDLATPGYDLIGAPEAVAAVRTALEHAGLAEASEAQVETARVERGLPRFGVDMDAETIPQEANLDVLGAISFTKGCYTGQEVVARIHFRGHVNRHLRWLSAPEPLPRGAAVLDADGKEVGEVRSSVVSPTRGPLAMAMVRREVEPGSDVTVRADSREIRARMAAIA
jgi:folate-binding protein YgfZ